MWWVIGGLALVYWAASQSRTRKQRIVQNALSAAVRDEIDRLYRREFGTEQRPITAAERDRMARLYFQSLLELFGARDFSSLMRAMTVRADEALTIQDKVLDRLVAQVPGASADILLAGREYSRLRIALTNAGETATRAGRESREI